MLKKTGKYLTGSKYRDLESLTEEILRLNIDNPIYTETLLRAHAAYIGQCLSAWRAGQPTPEPTPEPTLEWDQNEYEH